MPPNRRPLSPVGLALIGSQMAGFTLVGVVVDWLAGSAPWGTVGGTLLGFVAAFAQLARLVGKRAGP